MEKRIEELNLENDFLFGKVMSDMKICRKVLEKILGISIKKVEMSASQKTIDLLLEAKGVRLDVYVNDDKGTVYDVEMQGGYKPELPKRSRYYQGTVDLDLIAAGGKYTALRKTYIIFICIFDPFHEERHIYTFRNVCKENPDLLLGDETEKIFLNTKGKLDDVDDELLELLAYIENTTDSFAATAKSPLIGEIHNKVKQVKESKEMEVEYMTLLEKYREKLEEGIEEGVKIGIRAMISDNLEENLEEEKILKKLVKHFSLSEEEAKKYFDLYKQKTE